MAKHPIPINPKTGRRLSRRDFKPLYVNGVRDPARRFEDSFGNIFSRRTVEQVRLSTAARRQVTLEKVAKQRRETVEEKLPKKLQYKNPKTRLMLEIKRARKYYEAQAIRMRARASSVVNFADSDRRRWITPRASYIRTHWEGLLRKALGWPNKNLKQMNGPEKAARLDWDDWKALQDFERALHGGVDNPILKVLGDSGRYGGEADVGVISEVA